MRLRIHRSMLKDEGDYVSFDGKGTLVGDDGERLPFDLRAALGELRELKDARQIDRTLEGLDLSAIAPGLPEDLTRAFLRKRFRVEPNASGEGVVGAFYDAEGERPVLSIESDSFGNPAKPHEAARLILSRREDLRKVGKLDSASGAPTSDQTASGGKVTQRKGAAAPDLETAYEEAKARGDVPEMIRLTGAIHRASGGDSTRRQGSAAPDLETAYEDAEERRDVPEMVRLIGEIHRAARS